MHTNSSGGSENSEPNTDRGNYVTQRKFAGTTPPSVTVVQAVAAATGMDVDELPLLYEVVDPDALDALFASKHTGSSRGSGQVHFRLAGCEVTVTANGEVTVRAPSSSSPTPAATEDSRSPSKST